MFEVSLLIIRLVGSNGLLIMALFSDLTKFTLESSWLVFPGFCNVSSVPGLELSQLPLSQ